MRINPKDFFYRKTNHILPHYQTIKFNHLPDFKIDKLSGWIFKNCSGRFGVIKEIDTVDKETTTITKFGFEDGADLTLFILSDPAQIMNK